jgi:porphobilinogen synthase
MNKDFKRTRRLRNNSAIRDMVREVTISTDDFIYPLFVVEGEGVKEEISSMKGNYRFSVDLLIKEVEELLDLGIKSVLLFGIPDNKDEVGTGAYAEDGIIQKAVIAIKKHCPDMYVITDLCMCEYTCHGHCGILDKNNYVDNDKTLEYLGKIAISHAKAGADMIAPSDMMDGRVSYIRQSLDKEGFVNIPIMSYSAKYSSSYYGPFRDAAESAPSFGDRKTYQMDPANRREALREIEYDIDEGADLIIVKPALAYLDIIREARDNFNVPIVAYNVSGEYSMLKLAVENNILSEDVILETLISIKRAGADMIITYFAKDLAKSMK